MVHDNSPTQRLLRIASVILINTLVALLLLLVAQATFYFFIVGEGLPAGPFVTTWVASTGLALSGAIGDILLVYRWRWSITLYPILVFIIMGPLILISTFAQFMGVYDGELAYVAERLNIRTSSVFLLFSQVMLAVLGALIIVALSQVTCRRLRRMGYLD